MRAALAEENPNDSAIENCLPGVNRRFDQVHEELRKMGSRMERCHREVLEATKLHSGDLRDRLVGGLEDVLGRLVGEERDEEGGRARRRRVDVHADDNDEVDLTRLCFQTRRPVTVMEVYDEFKGRGAYEDYPIPGGLEAVEEKTKKAWRKGFSAADQKHFSRVAMLVSAIDQSVVDGRGLEDVVRELEEVFEDKGKAFSGLITELQRVDFIPKKGPRKSRRQSP